MPRLKSQNRFRIHVTMPEDLAEWVRAKARRLSVDNSAAIRMILLEVRRQEQRSEDGGKPVE